MAFSNLSLSPWVIPAAAILYGVIHSLMASLGVKDRLNNLFGDAAKRYYRLFYSLFSVITLLPVLTLLVLVPDKGLYSISAPLLYITLLLQVSSLFLLLYSLRQTKALDWIGVTQALGGTSKDTLNTTGLYRYLRHPLYTFSLLFIWLTPVMTRNLALLFASFTIYIIVGAVLEERKLLKTFGSDYRHYRQTTAFLIPLIF